LTRAAEGPRLIGEGERILIVNADDFGRSHGINLGVIKAHDEGILTSASLTVRWPAAREAARFARSRPGLSLGLHVDLGEWVFEEGAWRCCYEVVPLDSVDDITTETLRQLEAFRDLVGRDPSHLDSHQHVHVTTQAVSSVLGELADKLDIPLRGANGVNYCGNFYGQTARGQALHENITVQALTEDRKSTRLTRVMRRQSLTVGPLAFPAQLSSSQATQRK
jgi:predicted glycoside hydrolase/deacetylase ChbG (UPF0249 family)